MAGPARHACMRSTVEPPNKGHIETSHIVLCREVVLFSEVNFVCLVHLQVSFVERLSLFGRVIYRSVEVQRCGLYVTSIIYMPAARTTCDDNSCSHICAVIEGEDRCFCPQGLELIEDSNNTCGGTCMTSGVHPLIINPMLFYFPVQDINECDQFPCDQVCNNTEGSFECSCNSGFQLHHSTQKCEGKLFC